VNVPICFITRPPQNAHLEDFEFRMSAASGRDLGCCVLRKVLAQTY
jgi:hypothetical protein